MKRQTQSSVLKWSSLLAQRQLTSLVDIQNTSILITLLNRLQPETFNELYEIDERSSNSIQSILKCINQYYRRQLRCNVSPLTQNLNIFKSPITLWQLLIGVAIKGKNRDANINVILQMQLQEQSELMLLVQDVIQKLSKYDCPESVNGRSEMSSSSEGNRRRKESNFTMGGRNQYVNQLIQENQALKQALHQAQMEIQQNKLMAQQQRKVYEERLNHFKAERYQFLQVLTGGNPRQSRPRAQSSYKFRQSLASSQSKIMQDPLQGINVPVTGSLGQIAQEMLNTFKMMKREEAVHLERISLLEEHNKDLKLAVDRLVEEGKEKDEEIKRMGQLEKEIVSVKEENEELLRNETELLKIIREVEQQKQYLRETVQKLKQQKQQLIMNNQQSSSNVPPSALTLTSNTLNPTSTLNPNANLNIMKAPSMLLRQMASQLQPSEPQQLNSLLDDAKNPLLKEKYEKQLEQLQVKYNETREQNRELKQVNKMLQKTIHKSMEKSEDIQKCIEEGFREVFGKGLGKDDEKQGDEKKQERKQEQQSKEEKQQDQNSPIQIRISHQSHIQQTHSQHPPKQQPQTLPASQHPNPPNPKLHTFYFNIKQIIESYQQQQLLLIIQIQSLRKQLNDVIEQKVQKGKQFGQQKEQKVKQERKQLDNEKKDKQRVGMKKQQDKQQNKEDNNILIDNIIAKQNRHGYNFQKKSTLQHIQNQQHHKLTQSQPAVINKEQSQLHFAINISAPGATSSNNQSQKTQHISYHISNSHIVQKESQHLQQSEHFREEQENQPKVTFQDKLSRNRQVYPSDEFIEIQQGEELADSDIPRFVKKNESEERHGEGGEGRQEDGDHQLQQQKGGNRNLKNQIGMLGVETNALNGRSMLMASGIGLRWSKDQRKSFFAKSGFYNESFIQLTNRLNSQIHQQLQDLSIKAQSKSNPHHPTLLPTKPSNIPTSNNQPQPQPLHQIILSDNSNTLLTRLQHIKQSSARIRQLHLKQSTAVQSQLKQSSHIEQSQLTKLKVSNQLMKQHLTKVTGCLNVIVDRVRGVSAVMESIPNANQVNILRRGVKEAGEVIEQLGEILPQIEKDMQQSKVIEVQMLYHTEKTKREQLQHQIQLLLQTLVFFRNLAISESEDQ